MSNSLLIMDCVTKASRKMRIYNKPTKFKKIVNKVLSIIGLRWL